jgi:hypothetical protein
MASVTEEVRASLRAVADSLIPSADGMPGAAEVGVADGQLDRVLAVRPDLASPMERALAILDAEPGAAADEATLARLHDADPEAHDALLTVVAGGYYIDRGVRERLGYDGQRAVEVRPEIIPNYVEEGLIDKVLERGPIYRPVPDAAAAER